MLATFCSCAVQAWGRACVRFETVRPAGAVPSAIAWAFPIGLWISLACDLIRLAGASGNACPPSRFSAW